MTSVVWTMLSRLVLRMPALAGVILVSFALTRLLPGDPAVYFAGAAPTPEAIADLRRTLLLDQPLYAQFLAYLGDLAHGNFGRSLVTGQSVAQDLSTRLPATLELTIASTTLALLIAVPLGIVGARQKGSAMDHVCSLVSTSALAMPAFFTALLLVFLFYYLLGLAPAPLGRLAPMAFPPPERTGFMIIDASLARDWAVLRDAAAHLMLPALALAIAGIGDPRHARGDAGRAVERFHPGGPGVRSAALEAHLRLCVAQRDAAGADYGRVCVLVPDQCQRRHRKGFLLAGHRLLCARSAGRFRSCRRARFRAGRCDTLCPYQHRHRYSVWSNRRARAAWRLKWHSPRHCATAFGATR